MSYLDTSKIYFVYQLRLENSEDPFYIGKGKGNRPKKHFVESNLIDSTIKNNYIKNAISNNVVILVEKIHENLTEQEAFDLEMHYIAMYGRRNIGTGCLTNMTDGGEGVNGLYHSEETKKKLADIILQRPVEENRIIYSKISKSLKNNTERLIKTANTKRKRTPEQKSKTSSLFLATMAEKSDEEIADIIDRQSRSRRERNEIMWRSKCISEDQLRTVWGRADELYDYFKLGNGAKSMATKFGKKYGSYSNICKYFKSGWIPLLDPDWIKKFKNKA